MCRGLSCQQGSSHWLNVAVKWIQFFPPVSHNKCTRVMIGVWAGFTQRTWLFISNGQQFAHLSAHRAQYAPILPFFYPSLRPLLLTPALLHPYIYTSSFQSSFTFSFLLPLPPFLPLPPPSLFPAKWCHQSLLRPLPSLITQSASGCSWMHLYGLTARARGQARGYICHDSNALTQRSTLDIHTQEIKSADKQWCVCA